MAKSVPFRTRQFQQLRRLLPVNLVIDHGYEESELFGFTVDLSPRGIRVRSGGWLQCREGVEVLSVRSRMPLAHCRAAWVQQAGPEHRCEAGLEILS